MSPLSPPQGGAIADQGNVAGSGLTPVCRSQTEGSVTLIQAASAPQDVTFGYSGFSSQDHGC